jgi:xanthine dehydrogenase small subunit
MAEAIRFLLGDEERALTGIAPTLTVLEYLRRNERRTGTKEGCAEGDCGACTVVLAEPDGTGGLRHRAVNACIQFVSALHGRQLLTVEDLKGPDGSLHPVQQALVERHGSQCGFCTPGFVMQLYAGWLEGTLGDRRSVKDWLAGNLCRCTGYGPIVEAGLDAAQAPPPDAAVHARTAERLSALDDREMLHVTRGDQQVFVPRTADELASVYFAHPDAVLVAGATDVGLWVTKQRRRLKTLIDVTRIAELALLDEGEDGIAIGATVSHRAATASLSRLHPDLGELMRRFASIQIRNAGTVGGNIANGSPIGDLPPALIALDARLTLRRGPERREIPLEDFFIAYGTQDRAPGEFVESVFVPRLSSETRFACYKLSKRFDQDISALMGAFKVQLSWGKTAAVRIAFGGMAATPRRAQRAEAALLGKAFDEDAIEAAAQALAADFAPITDMRASADYRLKAAQNLLRRFWLENCTGERASTRVLELADG